MSIGREVTTLRNQLFKLTVNKRGTRVFCQHVTMISNTAHPIRM